jgi:nucleotide-binding universal stress UspA family protein
MKLMDVLAVTSAPRPEEHVISFAEQLARQSGGIASASVIGWMPSVPLGVAGWVVDSAWPDILRQVNHDLKMAADALAKRLVAGFPNATVHREPVEFGAARAAVGLRARHYDVAVVGRPSDTDSDHGHAILEGSLFQAGRPVVIVPPGWRPAPIGKSVVVCWKPTREAARALADASGLIAGAQTVSVVTVDAPEASSEQASELMAHLARRGVAATSTQLAASYARSEMQVVLEHAAGVGADLIVMGGYGRSRLSEYIFGGMTYEVTRTTTIPVLMSH